MKKPTNATSKTMKPTNNMKPTIQTASKPNTHNNRQPSKQNKQPNDWRHCFPLFLPYVAQEPRPPAPRPEPLEFLSDQMLWHDEHDLSTISGWISMLETLQHTPLLLPIAEQLRPRSSRSPTSRRVLVWQWLVGRRFLFFGKTPSIAVSGGTCEGTGMRKN